MSRIGKKPINIPSNVKINISDNIITCSGPKGTISKKIPKEILVSIEDLFVKVSLQEQNKYHEKFTGLARTIIANSIDGVANGFTKELEIIGVGYRAEVKNTVLNLSLGYSHPVIYNIPKDISVFVEKNTLLKITGCDKEKVGLVAAEIRNFRKPEPYKGKGIKYSNETIKRKVGKASGK